LGIWLRSAAIGLISSRAVAAHIRLASSKNIEKLTKPAAGRTRLFARFFSARVMWWDVITIGSRRRGIASRPGLRFSPLEIFAQCQLQPIPSRILHRGSGLNPAFVVFIRHRRPVRTRLGSCRPAE